MSGLDIRAPWTPLDREHATRVEAALGVYELRRQGTTVLIDYAGATSPFGLRGALLDAIGHAEPGTEFRAEVVSTYLSRWAELMSWYRTRHGSFPNGNGTHTPNIGQIGSRGAHT